MNQHQDIFLLLLLGKNKILLSWLSSTHTYACTHTNTKEVFQLFEKRSGDAVPYLKSNEVTFQAVANQNGLVREKVK